LNTSHRGRDPALGRMPAQRLSPVARSDHELTGLGAVPNGRGQYATKPETQDEGGWLAEAQREHVPGSLVESHRPSVNIRFSLGRGKRGLLAPTALVGRDGATAIL